MAANEQESHHYDNIWNQMNDMVRLRQPSMGQYSDRTRLEKEDAPFQK